MSLQRRARRKPRARPLGFESLEGRQMMSGDPVLSPAQVQQILARGAASAATDQAIIAVVDRSGKILGVREEQGVLNTIKDTATNVFAIDGAVAEARTAAFFSSNQAALTSRTIRFISQTTITQREVESSPEVSDPNSTVAGPGLVAPIGVGGHFPPGLLPSDSADLFGIEYTNRDYSLPGVERFNINPAFVPAGQGIYAPVSYGVQSGILPTARSRGIGTLPGGIPLYFNGTLVGGVGVFFPGSNGYATYEQGFVAGKQQTDYQRTNAPLALLAEAIAFSAAGGVISRPVGLGIPAADVQRIYLGGILLDGVGPGGPVQGPKVIAQVLAHAGHGKSQNGADQIVDPANDLYLQGTTPPTGWLVAPHVSPSNSSPLTAQQITQIINQGVAQANLTRAQIRLPVGQRTKMVIALSDLDGNVLGLYRMSDSTIFSIDVAVAKARNTAYYANPTKVQPQDLPASIKAGTALNNRDFRYLALPNFPTGASNTPSGPFSALNDPGINSKTGENLGPALPASVYSMNSTSVMGFAAFNPARNFRDPYCLANQNGIVFFPGSTPIYLGGTLSGGLGVSGDGVNQDDFVTYGASLHFAVPATVKRADQVFYGGVRLPYYVFPRNPTSL
jgi:uncharacterized protein GlcG (DUF336 family)